MWLFSQPIAFREDNSNRWRGDRPVDLVQAYSDRLLGLQGGK